MAILDCQFDDIWNSLRSKYRGHTCAGFLLNLDLEVGSPPLYSGPQLSAGSLDKDVKEGSICSLSAGTHLASRSSLALDLLQDTSVY